MLKLIVTEFRPQDQQVPNIYRKKEKTKQNTGARLAGNKKKSEHDTQLTGTALVFLEISLCFRVIFFSETAPLFIARLPGLCSSEGAEELQETNRMSVGGRMTGGKSDEEVPACACVLTVCAY